MQRVGLNAESTARVSSLMMGRGRPEFLWLLTLTRSNKPYLQMTLISKHIGVPGLGYEGSHQAASLPLCSLAAAAAG